MVELPTNISPSHDFDASLQNTFTQNIIATLAKSVKSTSYIYKYLREFELLKECLNKSYLFRVILSRLLFD